MGLATVTGICTKEYGCVIGEIGVHNQVDDVNVAEFVDVSTDSMVDVDLVGIVDLGLVNVGIVNAVKLLSLARISYQIYI